MIKLNVFSRGYMVILHMPVATKIMNISISISGVYK